MSRQRKLCGVCCENRSVGAGHARPAGLRLHPFRGCFAGRGLTPLRGVGDAAPYRHNPQSFSLPQMGTAARGLAALHPLQIPLPKQKAGANISFAPAVLLLRSHSLITLFVIFRTVSASSWESSYLFANFDCPFRILLTVHWTYPLVRYLLKSICGTE